MIMKQLFTLAAAATILAACSINGGLDQTPPTTERVPLRITTANSVSATVSTRSNVNDIQATTLDPSSTAVTGIFILKKTNFANTSLESYEKWNIASTGYVANSNIATNTNIQYSTATLYYPDSKSQNLGIYAYTPRDASYAGTDLTTNKVNVTINADQSTKANYLLSDVLWGCVGDGTNGGTETATGNKSNAVINATQYLDAKAGTATDGFVTTSGEVIVPMFHKATKIIVKITPTGMDVSKLIGATVNFYVNGSDATTPITTTTLKVTDGTIDALTPAGTPIIAPIKFTGTLGKDETGANIPATDSDATGSKGAIGDGSTTITGYACSGIILPQTVTAGNKLIEIVLSDGTTKYAYKIPTSGTPVTTFDSGKVYTYTITITASGLVLTTTVADWETAAGDTGSAELQ